MSSKDNSVALPEWDYCNWKHAHGEQLNPIEEFVFSCEPVPDADWRTQLAAALQHAAALSAPREEAASPMDRYHQQLAEDMASLAHPHPARPGAQGLVEVDCNCRQPGLGGDCDGSCMATGKVGRVYQRARPGAEDAEPVAFNREARADLLGAIRAAAAADSSCTLTYPQVHTLQQLLIALVGDAKAPADAGAARVAELEKAVVTHAMNWFGLCERKSDVCEAWCMGDLVELKDACAALAAGQDAGERS